MNLNSSEVRLHALDYFQILRNRIGVVLLIFCLVFVAAVAITHLMPKKYEAQATVEIVQNDDDLRLYRNSSNPDWAALNFVNTQFETISETGTLYRVVDKLDLVNSFNAGTRLEAAQMLGKMLDTSSRRGTNLIDISILAETPEEAADLANGVAEAYASRRQEMDHQRMDKAVTSFEAQVESQRKRVAKAQAEVMRLMREGNIVDLSQTNQSQSVVTNTPSVLANSEQRIFELRQQSAQLSTQLERLNQLSGDDLIKMAMTLDVADASVAQVYPQYLDQSIALERMQNLGLGRKHPKVLALKNEISKMKEYLASGVITIRDTLSTQLQIANESLARIEGLHADKKDQSIGEREEYAEYNIAKQELAEQRTQLQSMEAGLNQKRVEMGMTSTPIQIHGIAEPNPNPARPIVLLNLILGGILGLGAGIGMAFFLEYLDTSVKSIEQVEALLDTKVLAVVPKNVGLVMNSKNGQADGEAYRILRTNLEFQRPHPGANLITGVSGSPGEGKSTTITNLAWTAAEGGYTTLLIDADMRRPSLHRNFETHNVPGLSNFLAGENQIEQCVQRTNNPNLWFLPSGGMPVDPAGMLNSKAMVDMIADMKRRFDFVLIDSPPIIGVSDSSVLTREADLTMIVVQQGKLPEKALLRVKQAIETSGGTVAGVVMNQVDLTSDSQYSYYTSYYNYYANPEASVVEAQPSQPAPVAQHQPPTYHPQQQQQPQQQVPANTFAASPHPQMEPQHFQPAAQQQPPHPQAQHQQFASQQQQAPQNQQQPQPQTTDVY